MKILRNKNNLIFAGLAILVILPSIIFLVSRSTQIDSWDGWSWGSAQTMLTVRYWVRDGFLNHRMFFLLKGYHPEVRILDKPEFQFLTNDTLTGGLVGNRLYYNHYPSNYVIPYALLGKLADLGDRFLFRLLSIIFSLGSVLFLAGFIYMLANRSRWIALLAVFYYVISSNFLSYADALNNTPLDDFFRNLILFLSVCYWKAADSITAKRRIKIAMWILYFVLASVSLDSTIFVFLWLCILNFIETRKINLKEYFYWATAPVLAFAIQFTQNSGYLSFKGAALDFWGDFLHRSGEAPAVLGHLPPIIKNIAASLSTIGYFSGARTRYALPLLLVLIYVVWRLRLLDRKQWQYFYALSVSGFIFPLIFPVAGTFGYQGRQMAPAMLLILSLTSWKLWEKIKEKQFNPKFFVLLLCVIFFWTANFSTSLSYAKKWPNALYSRDEAGNKIAFLKNLNKISDSSTMILVINSIENRHISEFYADRIMLFLPDPETLLEYMDKIYSVIPGKVNFLLVMPDREYRETLEKMKDMRDYASVDETVDFSPDGAGVLRVIHK